ncbi:quinol oxidase [Maribellus comscasis]|uniref:Quinol oxidase n=1 Tax=Maribellus comscasis TaxID=2681766 RepID=A0A6I6JK04_9BACT|nr:TQO small subunit DoxD [Maribellus comscasis]QGY43176.1 quinol oxidase [Maribellus comscasis]
MNYIKEKINPEKSFDLAGLITLSLRLVAGWTYFSAFWRRIILTDKLNPELPGYIGEKFNHFLPNALGIKPLIGFLVSHPDWLWWAMVVFTIIEGIVGLLFMLGLFTRMMSIGILSLAFGILLGSGWIGTTCLDEWQIGILGIAAGFTIFLSGGGIFSIDNLLFVKNKKITTKKWFAWLASGELPLSKQYLKQLAFTGAMLILFVSLSTNQIFHGGIWGTLHNKSVKPDIEISNVFVTDKNLNFTVFRTEGVDVYGSFLIEIALSNQNGEKKIALNSDDLANFPAENISNHFVTKVKPGKHSLIIPLGGKADITIPFEKPEGLSPGTYKLVLTDVSGIFWTTDIVL